MLGGFIAMGGHVSVLIQPWEFVIILGAALGTFFVANPLSLVKDTGRACMEAFTNKVPKQRDYLDVLGVLYSLMRELRAKSRNEVEVHIDNPKESPIFQAYPSIMNNEDLMHFICDYCRLIIVGNVRPHEIEALMDEEIHTISRDRLKPYQAMVSISEALPALGIVAAVLGVIKAMGALNQSPSAWRSDRCRTCWYFRRYLLFLWRRHADCYENQNDAREEQSALCCREANPSGLHERFATTNCSGIWSQDNFGL